jgi:hypothetical protein
MDPQRFKDAYDKLQYLDDRLTHKIRRRDRGSLRTPTIEGVDDALKDVGDYIVELKEIMNELFHSLGSKPAAPKPGP